MFTVETEFDHTVVTVMDQTGKCEDLIAVFDVNGVKLKQYDEKSGNMCVVQLTEKQINDFYLAINSTDGTFIAD